MSASDAVRAFEQAFNDNDAEAMRSAAADGYVDRWPMPDVGAGIDGAIAFRAMIATAFPDMEQTLDEVIDQGETAASRWHVVATHKGEFFGVPASGKKVEMNGMSFYKVRDGKVAEIWNLPDIAGLMEQIGG